MKRRKVSGYQQDQPDLVTHTSWLNERHIHIRIVKAHRCGWVKAHGQWGQSISSHDGTLVQPGDARCGQRDLGRAGGDCRPITGLGERLGS